MKKYFVIGLNKTGTSTFHNLFVYNGLKSFHGVHWKKQLDTYDCFSDGGGKVNNFKALYEKYPDAIFILNTRSLQHWVMSRFKHGETTKQSWAFPQTSQMVEEWVKLRESFHEDVLHFFEKDPTKLILVDIGINDWISWLFPKIGLKHKLVHANKMNVKNEEALKNMLDIGFQSMPHIDRFSLLINDKDMVSKYKSIYLNNLV